MTTATTERQPELAGRTAVLPPSCGGYWLRCGAALPSRRARPAGTSGG